MSVTLKRKHHYVWRKYLNAWSTNSQIWCMRGNHIFQSELMGIGQKRDFYKIKSLEYEDVRYLKLMISKMDPRAQVTSRRWVSFFEQITSTNKYMNSGDSELDKLAKEILHNTEEDLYASTESSYTPILNSLLNHDFSSLSTEIGRFNFLHYVFNQYFRTLKMQERMIRYTQPPAALGNPNLENCWPILRHIFSDNMTLSLTSDSSYKLFALHNENVTKLLSGDQPVINTYAIGKPNSEPVYEIEIYYPISPNLAIIMSNNDKWVGKKHLSQDEVEFFNRAIIAESADQVYSKDRSTLEFYS